MSSGMDMHFDIDGMPTDHRSMNMQSGSIHQPIYSTSPVSQNFPMTYPPADNDPGGGMSPQTPIDPAKVSQSNMTAGLVKKKPSVRKSIGAPHPLATSHGPVTNSMASPVAMSQPGSRRETGEDPSSYRPNIDMTMQQIQQGPLTQEPPTFGFGKYQNAYSSSGFDMLGVLMRVATRPNPQINIGPVDLSCAFVVCDIEKHDLPIVYCSDMFERLTGYTRYEILGRNCRFLQAPDGKVQSGVKRKYVDDQSVLYLKNQISKRNEGQLSLINYRKRGQPFMKFIDRDPHSLGYARAQILRRLSS